MGVRGTGTTCEGSTFPSPRVGERGVGELRLVDPGVRELVGDTLADGAGPLGEAAEEGDDSLVAGGDGPVAVVAAPGPHAVRTPSVVADASSATTPRERLARSLAEASS